MEPRLRRAFERILLAMPKEGFDRFMRLHPTIVCQPAINGAAYSYYIPVWPQGRKAPKAVHLRVIYFRPDLDKLSDQRLVRLVAHEVAHLMLGHAEAGGAVAGEGDMHAEEAADRQAEAWGFKGAYSAEHRRQLAKRHKQAKEHRQT